MGERQRGAHGRLTTSALIVIVSGTDYDSQCASGESWNFTMNTWQIRVKASGHRRSVIGRAKSLKVNRRELDDDMETEGLQGRERERESSPLFVFKIAY